MNIDELSNKLFKYRYVAFTDEKYKADIIRHLDNLFNRSGTIIASLEEVIVIYEHINNIEIKLNLNHIKISTEELVKLSVKYDRFNISHMITNGQFYLLRLADIDIIYNELIKYSRIHKIKKLKTDINF
jgi:hypothetical protein